MENAKDVKKFTQSNTIFVEAHKTSKIYEIDKSSYKKRLRDNVTANYEKTNIETLNSINLEAKEITDKLNISDRVEPRSLTVTGRLPGKSPGGVESYAFQT